MSDEAPESPAPDRSRWMIASAALYAAVAAAALVWTRLPRPERSHPDLPRTEEGILAFAIWLFAYGVALAFSAARIVRRDRSSWPFEVLVLVHASIGAVATAGLMALDLGEGRVRALGRTVWDAAVLPAGFAVMLAWLAALGLVLTCRRAWAYFWVSTLAPFALILLKVR